MKYEKPMVAVDLFELSQSIAGCDIKIDYPQIVNQQDMLDFLQVEFGRIGAGTHITPREVIRDFIQVLDILFQNPTLTVQTLLGSDTFTYAQNPVLESPTDPQFAEFEL